MQQVAVERLAYKLLMRDKKLDAQMALARKQTKICQTIVRRA